MIKINNNYTVGMRRGKPALGRLLYKFTSIHKNTSLSSEVKLALLASLITNYMSPAIGIFKIIIHLHLKNMYMYS